MINNIRAQANEITLKDIGDVTQLVLLFPLIAIGWVAGLIWKIIRLIIASIVVGFKKGNG